VGECRGRRITVHKQPQPFGQVICLRPRMDEVVEWEVYGGTPPVNVSSRTQSQKPQQHTANPPITPVITANARRRPHTCAVKGQPYPSEQAPASLLYYRTYCGYRNHD
jgi:hypothetical protein